MACIDANGKLTRSGELILLAMMEPADVDFAAKESGLPLFKVRSAVRELSKAGLLEEVEGGIKVTDQGIGIPEEAISHLFERFYRAEDKLVRGGAGLGLYISKQIIESHGGSIWAESRLGEGSSFSFTLPLNEKGGNNHG